jgi:hypothetical protein
MKTIIIPTRFGFPTLDLYINGRKSTFKSGEEISVEDSVADVITNAIALEPKVGRNKSRLAQLADGSLTELTTSDLDGAKTIISLAFYGRHSIKKVEIPNSVTKIAEEAFDWCTTLQSVYLPEIPPVLTKVNAFSNIKTDCIFYCKSQESLNAYKAAINWSTLTETYTFKVEE